MYKLRLKNGLLYADAILYCEEKAIKIPDVIIDTGSSNTFILTDFLDTLNIGFDDSDELVVLFGIGGAESPAVRKKISCLSIGDISSNNLSIDFGVIEPNDKINGLIGLNFLISAKLIIDTYNLGLSSEVI